MTAAKLLRKQDLSDGSILFYLKRGHIQECADVAFATKSVRKFLMAQQTYQHFSFIRKNLTSNSMINQEVEILIVEDSLEDAELAIRALKKNHLANTIVHLMDGALALDFIFGRGEYAGRNTLALPKVILLDLKMPKVNGIEVLQQLKDNPATRSIPVVILTSSAEDPDIMRCYELGANSYIVKPVEFGNFSKTVADLGMYWMVLNRVKR